MRPIDTQYLNELKAKQLRPFLLLELNLGGTWYRYTDCDVPLKVDGNLYQPRRFKPSRVRYSTQRIVDSFTITVDDVQRDLLSNFLGSTPRGSTVRFKMVVLDSAYSVVPVDPNSATYTEALTVFEGEIDEWEATETEINIRVASIFTRWAQRTLAKQSASCRWKQFKGTECGYTGTADWCDRSYKRCQQLGNTANFGGFRFLPSIVDKEVWWGKVPAEP